MSIKISNNAWGRLAAGITDTDTTIPLINASLFPVIGVDEYFFATLVNTSNELEIVKVTAVVGNDLTVERGAEGTTARGYTQNDLVEQRVTAQTVYDLFTENSQDAAAAQSAAEQAATDAVTAKNEVFNLIPDPQSGDQGKILEVNSSFTGYQLVVNGGGGGGGGGSGLTVVTGPATPNTPAEYFDGNTVGSSVVSPTGAVGDMVVLKDLYNPAVPTWFYPQFFDGIPGIWIVVWEENRLAEYFWEPNFAPYWELTGETSFTGPPGPRDGALATMGVTSLFEYRVAFYEVQTAELRMYQAPTQNIGGSPQPFTQIGNGLPINATGGKPALCGLSTTEVAYHDTINGELRMYRFDGLDWSQIGNGLSIPTTLRASMARLSERRIAWYDGVNDRLRVYEFNGATWVQVGIDTTPALTGATSITALSYSEIAYISPLAGGNMTIYRFDENQFSVAGGTWQDPPVIFGSNPILAGLTDKLIISHNSSATISIIEWDKTGQVPGASKDNVNVLTIASDDALMIASDEGVGIIFAKTDRKNYALNGDFYLRRNGDTVTNVTHNQYVTDFWQFKYNLDGGTLNAPVQVDFSPAFSPTSAGTYYQMTFNAATTGTGANAYVKMVHRIEDLTPLNNFSRKATLSFSVQGSVPGEIGVLVRQRYFDSVLPESYGTSHQHIIPITGSGDPYQWDTYTITDEYLPFGPGVNPTIPHVSIEFYVRNGSGNFATNGLGEVNYAGDFTVTAVQMFSGPLNAAVGLSTGGLPFHPYNAPNRAALQDEALRQFQIIRLEGSNTFLGAAIGATIARGESITLPVAMRKAPTVTQYVNGIATPVQLSFGERLTGNSNVIDGDLQVEVFNNQNIRLSVVNTSGLTIDEYYAWSYLDTGELYCDAQYYTIEFD